MSCDIFSSAKALDLLKGKTIYLFGDSNVRALYKDLIWLLEDGRLIPNKRLKCKNELSHANDLRLSNGKTHSGRHYEEVRSYSENPYVEFYFMTRLYRTDFINTIKNLKSKPDVLAINSCVWDLSRWGSNGVEQYKQNVNATFSFLKSYLPSTRIIWLSTLPPSFKSHGGFLTKEIEFLRNMLPWHISFANKYASNIANSYSIDVLDLHYNFRFLLNHHTKDGIHWDPKAMRYATNLLLTHLALCWNCKLPRHFELDKTFVEHSQNISKNIEIKSNERIEQKTTSNSSTKGVVNKNIQKKRTRKRKSKFTPLQNYSAFNCFKQQNQLGALQFSINHPLNDNGFNTSTNVFTTEPTFNNDMFTNGYQQATSSVWCKDYPVNNFESQGFMFDQNWNWNNYANKNVCYQFNSQVNNDFGYEANIQNQSHICKRKPNKVQNLKLWNRM